MHTYDAKNKHILVMVFDNQHHWPHFKCKAQTLFSSFQDGKEALKHHLRKQSMDAEMGTILHCHT